MDQDAFRETYREVNEVYCAFEKSILTNECRCSQAERFCIAEREGVHCRQAASQARCLRWLGLLRDQARFALRTDQERQLLPHGKAIRLQVGGMRGLNRVLDANDGIDAVADIDHALGVAEQRFGSLEALPYSDVMREVAAYQVRRRSRRRRRD
jgi:hypothetical protein